MNTNTTPIGYLDGIAIKPCVGSGYCCTKTPCAYGERGEDGTNWAYYPAFGAGCCMPNEMRKRVISALTQF